MFEILSRVFSRTNGLGDSADDRIVHKAVEAVVAGTDPRLRLVPDYQKRLFEATKKSILYVRQIAKNLTSATLLSAESYRCDPRIHLIFGSADSMTYIVSRDATLRAFRRDEWSTTSQDAFGLLIADRQVKHVLGMELHGDIIQREVSQTVLDFSDHRLRALATSEEGTLRLTKIGAFHQLLQLARDSLFHAKEGIPIIEAGRDGVSEHTQGQAMKGTEDFPSFDILSGKHETPDVDTSRLDEIDHRRRQMGAMALRLDDYLDIVSHVLSHPENYLRHNLFAADVDRMGRLVASRDETESGSDRVSLWEFVRPDRKHPVACIVVRLRKCDFQFIPQVSGQTTCLTHLAGQSVDTLR